MSEKDLKAIAEEMIADATIKKEMDRKPIHDLYESLKFLNSMGYCMVRELDAFIEVRFTHIVLNIFVTNTPYKYRVRYWNDNSAKTECNSLEQLVRFLANFGVTKDFDTAAEVAGCEYVERDEDYDI